MDLNAIKKAITATVSGGQYLPSDKIGFAGLPQPSSNFDAHFGAGSFDILGDLLYDSENGYVTILSAWIDANIDQVNEVLKMADILFQSKAAVENLLASEGIQNGQAFPKALHELCSKVDAFHSSLQAMPARNPRFSKGSEVLDYLENFGNEHLVKKTLLPKWSNAVESFCEASNTRFLLERELEVRRWQTIRNANCTDLDSWNDRDELWRKLQGKSVMSDASDSWPGVRYTPRYLFENHRTLSKIVTFSDSKDQIWVQHCAPNRLNDFYIRRFAAVHPDSSHPTAVVKNGQVEVKSDKGVVHDRNTHMDYHFITVFTINKALIEAWPKEEKLREQAEAVNRVMGPLTQWMTAVQGILAELHAVQKQIFADGLSLFQNLDEVLKDARGNLVAGELDYYRADCKIIVELLLQVSVKAQNWKAREISVPKYCQSGDVRYNGEGSKPEKNEWCLSGLSHFDQDHLGDCRIRITVNAEGAPIPETGGRWPLDTKLYDAWTSWMTFPSSMYSKVTRGTVATGDSNKVDSKTWEVDVKFDQPFKNTPTVTSWLTSVHTQAYCGAEVWVCETAITREGCTIRMCAGKNTLSYGIGASWLAYDPTETNIYTGLHYSKNSAYGPGWDNDDDITNFQSGALLELRTVQPGRYISWKKNFTAPPATMVGLRKLDFDTFALVRKEKVAIPSNPMQINYRESAPNHYQTRMNVRLHAGINMPTKDGGILELYSWDDSLAWPNEIVVIAAQ